MDYELMFPSNYIKAADLNGRDFSLTVTTVAIESLKMRGGASKKRGVMRFEKTEKGLVLNRTNGDTIAKLLGRDTEDWIGKRITLFPTTTKFGRETVPCIRVRDTSAPVERPETGAQEPTTMGQSQPPAEE